MTELNLSLTTLKILAWSKVIFFIYGVIIVYFIIKNKKPWAYVMTTGIAIVVFYLIFSWPLQRMWWGNVGDEFFVMDFLGQTLLGNPLKDFYYGWLPAFYPPLYFWATGILAHPFASNAIVAGKIGVAGVLILSFIGAYLWQKYFWGKVATNKKNKSEIVESRWFWFLLPVLYFAMLDFDTVIFKPYEFCSALFSIILIGMLARGFYDRHWQRSRYIFIGISAGILFLIYYFWWIMLIPVAILLLLQSGQKLQNFKRVVIIGLIMLIVSSIFLVPLFWSYIKYGIENGQAIHFIPQDFFTFAPWKNISIQSIFYIVGLCGLLLFRKKSFVKASLYTLLVIAGYQLLQIVSFLLGQRPIQSSKAFWFLGTAAIAVGLSYFVIYFYQNYLQSKLKTHTKSLVIFSFTLLLMRLPFAYFVDDPVALQQIEKDLISPAQTIILASDIKKVVPDYGDRTWLSSGSMELGAYLPLSYYIAHNIHFSHHAAQYSQRLKEIFALSTAKNPEEFMQIIDNGYPRKIDSLIFYGNTGNNSESYAIYFWQDNWPNGGKDAEIYIPKKLIDEKYWQLVYNKNNWVIFLKK